jgi:alkylation response protein AidB-like acyl-CoA dehydrogenase
MLTVTLLSRLQLLSSAHLSSQSMPMLECLGSGFFMSEKVGVPSENSIAKGNDGLLRTISILHPDRLHLACTSLRPCTHYARDAYACPCQQKTFGQQIIKHAPIRSKTALFGLFNERVQTFLEQLVICGGFRLIEKYVNALGMTALLKITSIRYLQKICGEALRTLRGAAYSESGKAKNRRHESRCSIVLRRR